MMAGASVLDGGGTMLGPSRAQSPLAGRGKKKARFVPEWDRGERESGARAAGAQ